MIYICHENVTVISATWTQATSELLVRELRKITDKPVKYVIDTHFHLDRTGGNPYFKKIGAQIIGSKMTSELMKRTWDSRLKGTLKDYPGYPTITLVLPHLTFENQIELEDGKIQVRYFGPSRTVDDVVVYFPREQVLFRDCVLKEKLGLIQRPSSPVQFSGLIQRPNSLAKFTGPILWPNSLARSLANVA